jgi:hypothetical protein
LKYSTTPIPRYVALRDSAVHLPRHHQPLLLTLAPYNYFIHQESQDQVIGKITERYGKLLINEM